MKKWKYVFVLVILVAVAVTVIINIHDGTAKVLFKRGLIKKLGKRYEVAKMLDDPGIRVILAGTGGPPVLKERSHPCTAVIANGEFLVFDAGPSAIRQLALFGYPTKEISRVFLTHMHSDHMGGVASLINTTWIDGRKNKIQVYGPDDSNRLIHSLYPPTSIEYISGTNDTTGGQPDRRRINELTAADFSIPDVSYIPGVQFMIEGITRAHTTDVIIRASNKQITGLDYTHAFAEAHPIQNMSTADDPEHHGWGELVPVYTSENGKLRVFAFLVDHYPCFPSYGYRVEYAGRSVVISGDTEKCTYMAKCAAGADMLVHEALNMELVALVAEVMEERFGDSVKAATYMAAAAHHIHTLDVARAAEDAGVAKLVLTHIMLPTPFRFMEKLLIKGMDDIYHGEIIVGKDGLDLYLKPES